MFGYWYFYLMGVCSVVVVQPRRSGVSPKVASRAAPARKRVRIERLKDGRGRAGRGIDAFVDCSSRVDGTTTTTTTIDRRRCAGASTRIFFSVFFFTFFFLSFLPRYLVIRGRDIT
jgi:hypothetical protein